MRYLFPMARWWRTDAVLILLLTAFLIWPLFTLDWMENWGSIESTFIADARMLIEAGFRPQWQPNWYCGTRWDYIYPPALRYGSAAIAHFLDVSAARGYHLYTAVSYCLGILGVYFLIRTGQGSRLWAWIGAIAAATVSPAYLIFERIRNDVIGEFTLPMRLNVLVRYGEGPHMTAWALIPFALVLAWRGLRPGHSAYLAGAAVVSALAVSNNFYGATALAILFPVLCWSLWLEHREKGIWFRGAAIAALAYGLCAFWLTPSYIRITLDNMRFVSIPGNHWSRWAALGAVILFVAVTLLWKRPRAWPVFVWGTLYFLCFFILGLEYYNLRVIGEGGRLIPELDVFLIIAAVWTASCVRPRWAAAAVLLIAISMGGKRYVRHAWQVYYVNTDYMPRVEYQMNEWMHRNMPDARALPTGSVRFWYNVWFTQAQTGGGSEQGVLNPAMVDAQAYMVNQTPSYSIRLGQVDRDGRNSGQRSRVPGNLQRLEQATQVRRFAARDLRRSQGEPDLSRATNSPGASPNSRRTTARPNRTFDVQLGRGERQPVCGNHRIGPTGAVQAHFE